LLHIGIQTNISEDDINIWFEIDTKETKNERKIFFCMYTGNAFHETSLEFRKTVIYNTGLVVHIYEKVESFLSNDEMRI
jgi:hypothetical protein